MDEYSPSCSNLDSTPISSDIDSDVSSELSEGEPRWVREKIRADKCKRYLSGGSRKTYKISRDLDESLETSPQLPGVCSCRASALAQVAEGFKQLRHHGTELKKRKRSLPHPKHPNRDHYRNAHMQNEWIRGNIFDTMGNYLFCHQCVVKALSVSPQRLSRQRKV